MSYKELETRFKELEWLHDMSTSKTKKLAILDADIVKCKAQILKLKIEIDMLRLLKDKVRELHRKQKNL